nr:threonine/serine exporter family protein [Dorea formicigenerans]
MEILWHDYAEAIDDIPITNAGIIEKSSVIGRTGLMLLSCGTGAWRVRQSMNTLAEQLGLTCTADIGLMSIEYTCFDGEECYSQSLCLTNTGVNTSKLNRLEQFINKFSSEGVYMTGEELHSHLDQIEKIHGLYSPTALGLAAALACGAFTFLLGGGPVEMFCAFAGAGIGNFVRCKLGKHHFTLFLCIFASVTSACLVYAGLFEVMKLILGVSEQHEAGYICSMLFIIPGFPFITSGIDLAKLDMRSGLERLTYAIIIITVATMTAWIMALILKLQPVDFLTLNLQVPVQILFRLAASFCGVFGFSVMFNSPRKLAATAGCIGAVANTLRLEMVDLANMPPAAAAFIGALVAGILASMIKNVAGFPRISVTVPSIVIMVPGLYLYRAIYNLGIMSLHTSAEWFAAAFMIILALPLGLIFARILTDKTFRYCT